MHIFVVYVRESKIVKVMDNIFSYGQWVSNPPPSEEVVITGLSGRFPESNNVLEFQNNLFNKKDMVTDDDRRWKIESDEIPRRTGKIYNIDRFDAGFFKMHHRQANTIDPLTRKFLETAIEAILDAGVNPSDLQGSRTGVYLASSNSDVENSVIKDITESNSFRVTGSLRSFIPHHLSYFLKLKGPSCNVDSACSSSFYALDVAFKSIREGKCECAIVGAANLVLDPVLVRNFFRLGTLSNDGACKVFDEKADGYAKSETVACVFLQKARNAKRIYAQIINMKGYNDGFKSLGISYPSTEMQQKMITEILEESSIDPSEIEFFEAHGSGTQVGDLPEAQAIDCAVAKKRKHPLLIGSVKSNMGHTEAASGLCSLVKMIIAMETDLAPPNIHLHSIKKGLEGFEEGRLKVVTETTKLNLDDGVIGLSNFGFGGSNQHLLLRKFKKVQREEELLEDNSFRLICVSGRTEKAVLKLLNDINSRKLNYEYVGLLHQIFKNDVDGHIYRGFTIISEHGALRTDVKRSFQKPKVLYAVFGSFDRGYTSLSENSIDSFCFKSTIQKINSSFDENFNFCDGIVNGKNKNEGNILSSFAVQIGVVEMLKLLKLEVTVVYTDYIGYLVSIYYNGDISLEVAVHCLCEIYFGIRPQVVLSKIGQHCYKDYKDHLRKGAELLHNYSMKHFRNMILNVSDETLTGVNVVSLAEGNFLEALGRIYQEGYNLHLHMIYPLVKFPVCNNIPMIAPLIQWDWHRSWHTWKYNKSSKTSIIRHSYEVSIESNEDKYLSGHVVGGRNLIPASHYLMLVWKTLLEKNTDLADIRVSVVFKDCEFIKAVTLPKKGSISILVTIDNKNGNFEIVDKESVVVKGKVLMTKTLEHQFDSSPNEINEQRTQFLDHDEVYKELNLRGYNFRGMFKSIVKCNLETSVGLVAWKDNWTTFIDSMLQLEIFQTDTRFLRLPVGIEMLSIDKLKHLNFVKEYRSSCPVYVYKNCRTMKSGGVEICGIECISQVPKKLFHNPVLEKYLFVPNNTNTTLENAVRHIVQVILENSLDDNFKAVEIVDDFTKPNSNVILPLVSRIVDDIPLVVATLIISSKTSQSVSSTIIVVKNFSLTSTSNMLLIISSDVFQRPVLFYQILSALKPNGFLLTREQIDFTPLPEDSIEVISEHHVGDEKLILLQKVQKRQNVEYIEIIPGNFDWIPQAQNAFRKESDVVVYSQGYEPSGVIGLVNCLRQEPGGCNVRCFLIKDEAPKFDPELDFYKNQLKKHMAINVYKNKTWGTLRHLILDDVKEVEGQHFLVQNTTVGDLSSVQWVQDVLSTSRNVFTFYSALNSKDILQASGRLLEENRHRNRIRDECPLGHEFSGIDINKRRVMGITGRNGLATALNVDDGLLWQVPDHWTLQDASTVPVVYSTVIYALLKVIKIKPGMSILIHSATGGVGLAALNICLHYKLRIYVTVGTTEKGDFLNKCYPQIPESCIGSSRDTSFESMINKVTQGRGVDVVVNSLSGKELTASVRCTASGGHFFDFDKYKITDNKRLSLLLLEKNVSYHNITVDQIVSEKLETKIWIVDEIYQGIKLGYVKPLPRKVFQYGEIAQAFEYMALGPHIGKVLVQLRDENYSNVGSVKTVFKGRRRFTCDPEKVYVIVGGLGGFGLELTDWFYLRGAKKLILVSRHGIETGYQQQRINNWRSHDVTVRISTKDVTTKQGCFDLVNDANRLGSVDGIFNLALVLNDALFENQDQKSFEICMAPKSQATMCLDRVTRDLCPHLNYFVVFSSVTCGRGNAGQTNYGMASSIAERICEKRKSEGLPGLAIQWGAVGDVGTIANMQKYDDREVMMRGCLPQKISSCLEVLDQFLNQDNPVVSSMVVAGVQQSRIADKAVDRVASILGIKDIKTVNPYIPFAQLGLDSITVNEIVHLLKRDFEIVIPTQEFKNMTFSKLSEMEAGPNGS